MKWSTNKTDVWYHNLSDKMQQKYVDAAIEAAQAAALEDGPKSEKRMAMAALKREIKAPIEAVNLAKFQKRVQTAADLTEILGEMILTDTSEPVSISGCCCRRCARKSSSHS